MEETLFTFFSIECLVADNKWDAFLMFGSEDRYRFFSSKCSVGKNVFFILSPHHLKVNHGWKRPTAQMNRINFNKDADACHDTHWEPFETI